MHRLEDASCLARARRQRLTARAVRLGVQVDAVEQQIADLGQARAACVSITHAWNISPCTRVTSVGSSATLSPASE